MNIEVYCLGSHGVKMEREPDEIKAFGHRKVKLVRFNCPQCGAWVEMGLDTVTGIPLWTNESADGVTGSDGNGHDANKGGKITTN